MKMNDNKPVLYSIIVLLCFFSFLSYYGTNRRSNLDLNLDSSESVGSSGIIPLGDSEYVCESDDCGYVSSYGEELNINYPTGSLNFYPYINDTYSFIKDGSKILLFNMITGSVEIDNLEAIKFYGMQTNNNTIIVKKDGLWGVLSLDNLKMIIDFEYDYLGLPDKTTNNLLEANYYIAKAGGEYYIYDAIFNQNYSYAITDLIYDFNNKYIIVDKNGEYGLIDYNFNSYLTDKSIVKLECTNNYIGIITTDNKVIIYDNALFNIVYEVEISKTLEFEMNEEDGVLTIYLDNDIVFTSN